MLKKLNIWLIRSTSLSNYHPANTPQSITQANGSLSKVVDSISTHLSYDIELLSILHVSSFPFNLLSISKITKTLNCFVSFYPSMCIFQDLETRKMIGMGPEICGLYYLDLHLSPSRALQSPISALQWHCCLGHPSLFTMKCQIPSLHHELTVHCKAC